ncbi:MAG: hypothetical protein ACQESR_12920 [Planctomycetota bacterium]
MESCPTQAVLPLVGLAADKVIRDRYNETIRPRRASFSSSQASRWHGARPAPPTGANLGVSPCPCVPNTRVDLSYSRVA